MIMRLNTRPDTNGADLKNMVPGRTENCEWKLVTAVEEEPPRKLQRVPHSSPLSELMQSRTASGYESPVQDYLILLSPRPLWGI
jgi:hypothetical protein